MNYIKSGVNFFILLIFCGVLVETKNIIEGIINLSPDLETSSISTEFSNESTEETTLTYSTEYTELENLTAEYETTESEESTTTESIESTTESIESTKESIESTTESIESTKESIESTTENNELINCTTVVTTDFGSVLGCEEYLTLENLDLTQNKNRNDILVYSFKGIPYAEPPIDSLRFRKPVPKTFKFPTILKAFRFGSACIQPPTLEITLPGDLKSEDCLFLNIFTPTLNSSANLPVMFYIPGGAFLWGAGSEIQLSSGSLKNSYDGSQLAIRDVVVITINYRLGVFGFLYGNSSEAPGNMGFWDQAMALKWTIQNIRAFGGNPNNITLFGQSAGSMSVSNHIVSNVTRNLFQRAIMQSGSGYVNLFSKNKDYSYQIARRFASNSTLFLTGSCNDDKTWIQCLRHKTADELLIAQTTAFLWNPSHQWYSAILLEFVPMFGDEFIPISIPQALKEGNFRNDINILIGHTEMEGAAFTLDFDFVRFLDGRYIPELDYIPLITKNIVFMDIKNIFFDSNTFGTTASEKYTETFPEFELDKNNGNRIRGSAVYAFSDYVLTCPTILFGYYFAKNSYSGSVFQYRLTYANSRSMCADSEWANVTHGDDILLVFGTPFRSFGFTDDDKKLSFQMMNIWTHFSRYDSLPKVNGNAWPPYIVRKNETNLKYLELHASDERLGRVFTNRYNGSDGFRPSVINNCLNFWDEILSAQF